MKKLLALTLVPGIIMAAVFIAFGESFEASLSQQAFLEQHRNNSDAWLIASGMLIGDLILPVPASGIMAAIGNIYGITTGFIINFCAFTGSSLLAYLLALLFSRSGSKWLCSKEEMNRYREWFDSWGGHAVIVSRLFPILPEVTALTAGFTRMNFKKYVIALTAGSAPVCFLYTWLGYSTREEPFWGIIIAVSIPLILFVLMNKYIFNKRTD